MWTYSFPILEEHLSHDIKTDLEKMVENIPKIKKTFDTIYNFVQILKNLFVKFRSTKTKKHCSGKYAVKVAPSTAYLTGTSQIQQADQAVTSEKNEQQNKETTALDEIHRWAGRQKGYGQ